MGYTQAVASLSIFLVLTEPKNDLIILQKMKSNWGEKDTFSLVP